MLTALPATPGGPIAGNPGSCAAAPGATAGMAPRRAAATGSGPATGATAAASAASKMPDEQGRFSIVSRPEPRSPWRSRMDIEERRLK